MVRNSRDTGTYSCVAKLRLSCSEHERALAKRVPTRQRHFPYVTQGRYSDSGFACEMVLALRTE